MKIERAWRCLPWHRLSLALLFALSHSVVCGQSGGFLTGATATVEMSGTLAHGDYAPLWLSANRYGLSSVNTSSSYERLTFERPAAADSAKILRLGYGVDFALLQHNISTLQFNQAYVELQYKNVTLTVGSRRQPIALRNQMLTSGGLGLGNNAAPIPQARLEVDYFDLVGTNGWWMWKGYVSYGFMTDNSFVRHYALGNHRYTLNTIYHEKALFWRFGRTDIFPLQFEIGLQMAAEWGGTTYNATGRNHTESTTLKHKHGFRALWNTFFASGSDETDGVDRNTQGNHVGSYTMALTYRNPQHWGARAYFERFFEDQSMLTLQYGISDHLLGLEISLPEIWPVSGVVIEHISTRSQSGAVYHDKTATLPEKMNGRDNYYNHNLYNGWQHWGQTLGHPFLTSPLYNKTKAYDTNGNIAFLNNRIMAWHFGFSGRLTDEYRYRLLLSVTHNWGTYDIPLDNVYKQNYFMAEVTYTPRRLPYWRGSLALGADHGGLLGNSIGAQLIITRQLQL